MSEENSVLAEKQCEQGSTAVGEYVFEMGFPGSETKKSSVLKTHKPGIDLHFYRYGLFPIATQNNRDQKALFYDQNGQIDNHPEPLHPEGAPKVEGFFYGRTALGTGYIYLMDANDPNMWWEYFLDDLDNYYPVIWKAFNDVRKPEDKKVSNITFKQDTELWIAYSPVQWSIDYHRLMRTDEARRKERMIKIKCTGFKDGEAGLSADVLPYDKVFTAYHPSEHFYGQWFSDKLKENKADFNADKQKDPEAIKEDMHITLHHPTGALQDLVENYSYSYLQFKALTEAIQTGESQQEAFVRISKGHQFDTSKNREHQYLFALANFSYQHAFGSKENMKKYSDYITKEEVDTYLSQEHYFKSYQINRGGVSTQYRTGTSVFDDGVDLKKVVGILGFDERRKVREELLRFRQTVYTYYTSDYPFKYADDYVYNTSIRTLDGRSIFHQLAETVIASPYQIDNHLQLRSQRVYNADEDIKNDFRVLFDNHKLPDSFKFRKKTANPDAKLESKHIVVALAAGKLNVQVDEGVSRALKEDLSIKLAGVTKGLIGVFADRAFTVLRNQNFSSTLFDTSNLQSVQKMIADGINKGLVVNGDELFNVTPKGIIATFEDQIYLLSTEGSSAFKLEMISNTPGNNEVTTIASQKLTEKQIANNNFNNKLAKAVDSNAFRGVFGLLALYNLKNSVDQLMANRNTRNVVNVIGFAADVAIVASSFAEKMLPDIINSSTKLGETLINQVKLCTKITGAVGGILTGTVCIIDSVDLFNINDNDAGFALIGAGIGFGAAGIISAFGSNPIGWGCLLAATSLYFLSEALKDDEFQKIYKHYLLSNYEECSKEGLNPMQYTRQILQRRAELTHPEYLENREDKSLPNLESPHNAYCILMEKTIMPYIKVKGIAKKVGDTNIFRGWYRKFQIQVPFYNYIHTEDDLKNIVVNAQFYPQHPQSFSSIRTDNVCLDLKLGVGEQKGMVLIDVDIDRHTSYVGEGVYCNVYLQVILPNSVENFFPFDTIDGKQRMLKVKTYLGYNTRGSEKIKGYYSIITQ